MIESPTEAAKDFAEAWSACWAELKELATTQEADIKGKEGIRGFSYKYAGLGDILTVVRPILARHGLAVSQSVVPVGDGIGVETVVSHKNGGAARFGPLPMPAGRDPRQVGSAITYARRYGLSAALGIASDEDNDASGTFDTEPPATPTATAPVDAHETAWVVAQRLFRPEDQVNEFMSAMESAGVKKGTRATTEQSGVAITAMRAVAK